MDGFVDFLALRVEFLKHFRSFFEAFRSLQISAFDEDGVCPLGLSVKGTKILTISICAACSRPLDAAT